MFMLQQKQKVDEKFKKRFFNTYRFSNHDSSKFFLLLQKGIYSYIETYKRLASFLSKSGLAWEEDFKKSKVKLGLLPDIDMLLMVEKHCTKRHIFFLQMF